RLKLVGRALTGQDLAAAEVLELAAGPGRVDPQLLRQGVGIPALAAGLVEIQQELELHDRVDVQREERPDVLGDLLAGQRTLPPPARLPWRMGVPYRNFVRSASAKRPPLNVGRGVADSCLTALRGTSMLGVLPTPP